MRDTQERCELLHNSADFLHIKRAHGASRRPHSTNEKHVHAARKSERERAAIGEDATATDDNKRTFFCRDNKREIASVDGKR